MPGSDTYPLIIAALALVVSAAALGMVLSMVLGKSRKPRDEDQKSSAAGIERLEKLFDQAFADTFFVLRETLSYALRQNPKSDQRVEDLTRPAAVSAPSTPVATAESRLSYLEKTVAELTRGQRETNNLIKALRLDLSEPQRRSPHQGTPIAETRPVNQTRSAILNTIQRLQLTQPLTQVSTILEELEREGKSAIEVVRELEALHADGLIELSDPLPVHTNTTIVLKGSEATRLERESIFSASRQ